MKFPPPRFYIWAIVFVVGVIVGATVVPSYYTKLSDSATATTVPFTITAEPISEKNGGSSALESSTPSTLVLPAGFEQRLYAHLGSVLQAAVTEVLSRQIPITSTPTTGIIKSTDAVSLTDSQIQAYEGLRARLEDSVKNRSMTWSQLVSSPEMTQLPLPWRAKILNQAAEMLTRGELVPAQFIDTQR